MSENLTLRREIAETLLGYALDEGGFAKCPGMDLHNGKSGRRDFQVVLTQVPTARCFHSSCAEVVTDFNAKLRSNIGKAESGGGMHSQRPSMLGNVAQKPEAPRLPKRPVYDAAKLASFAARVPFPITEEWLAARSPIAIPVNQDASTAELFLGSLYQPGERVLVFTREYSQGDFIFQAGGRGSYRLADKPQTRAVPSSLPNGGPLGVWFLAQPISGRWLPNFQNQWPDGSPKLGRRHKDCVTSWRYLVLESDTAPADLWLRALVQLPLAIQGIYTSGGKSIHALCKVDAGSKEEWDALRGDILPIVAALGADPAAMTAVRLTRLPGALRYGTRGKDGKTQPFPKPVLQRLLYLNPSATASSILDYRP